MSLRHRSITTVIAIVLAGCGARGPAPTTPPPVAVARTHAPYTDADVAFMQGMIAHHGQALDMTALVPERSDDPTLEVLAERIEQTQLNEIERMSRWLRDRGETVPDPSASGEHAGHAGPKPGLLMPDELARLAASNGPVVDRRVREYMVRHHEQLIMLRRLNLTGSVVSDAAIRQLTAFRRLTELDLSRTPVTWEALHIAQWLPELVTVCVEGTGIKWLTKRRLEAQLRRNRQSAAAIRATHPTFVR